MNRVLIFVISVLLALVFTIPATAATSVVATSVRIMGEWETPDDGDRRIRTDAGMTVTSSPLLSRLDGLNRCAGLVPCLG